MMGIGLIGAFLGGVLSLISPCSALLLPSFFAYAFGSTRALLGQTVVFFLGLCTTLVPIGMGLAAALATHRDVAITVGGWLLIALGVYSALGGGFSFLNLQRRGSTFALGAVYGFAGFCAGPLLGAVLATAAMSGSWVRGALTMVMYALGMAAPLFALAWAWDRFDVSNWRWLRPRSLKLGPFTTTSISLASGAVFVLIGVLFLTSYGSSQLPSLFDIDAQFSIQAAAQSFAERIPDAWVLFAASLIATVAVGIRAWGPHDGAQEKASQA